MEILEPTYNGYLAIDGEQKTAKYKVTDWGVHVFTTAPKIELTTDRLVADRSTGRGGQKLCEVVFFAEVLSDAERKQVQDYLRAKWQAADTAPTVAYDSVKLSGGSSLNFSDGAVKIAASSVTVGDGAATVTAESFTATDSLSFACDETGSCGTLTVAGTFTLGAGGTVRVSFPKGCRPDVGRIPLVKATTFVGGENLAGWTPVVEGSPASRVRSFDLVLIGDTLYLSVTKFGSALILR